MEGRRGIGRRLRRAALLMAVGLPLPACAPPPPVVLSPEAALPACEAEALAELRRADPLVVSASLDPLEGARVDRREPPPGQTGVGLVIEGRGAAVGGPGGFRYTCLVGTSGEVLFVAIVPQGTSAVLAECAGRDGGPRACLRDLMASADRALAQAEAEAIAEARRREGRRSEVDEPAAASIGAWRVYRDAECTRRHGAEESDQAAACLVELTRSRIGELRG